MRRIDLGNVMTESMMAILTDEENTFVYDVNKLYMYHGEKQNSVLRVNVKMNVKASKEEKDMVADKLIALMTALNTAFNHSVGAPESMKLFKVLDKEVRYSGNETVTVILKLATLATGSGSALYTLLSYTGMTMNIWNTEANIFEATEEVANETYGLGNALRSWKTVMRNYGKDMPMPAYRFNYVE